MEFTVRRGETLTILLDDMDGIADTVASVEAHLRPGTIAPARPFAAEDAVAVFTVAPRAAEDIDDVAGWSLTLSAATTDGLALGSYVVDARILFEGGTELVTDPIAGRVIEPATVRA